MVHHHLSELTSVHIQLLPRLSPPILIIDLVPLLSPGFPRIINLINISAIVSTSMFKPMFFFFIYFFLSSSSSTFHVHCLKEITVVEPKQLQRLKQKLQQRILHMIATMIPPVLCTRHNWKLHIIRRCHTWTFRERYLTLWQQSLQIM